MHPAVLMHAPESFVAVVCCAFGTFGAKAKFHSMRAKAMAQDFSWQTPAASYSDLYRRTSFA